MADEEEMTPAERIKRIREEHLQPPEDETVFEKNRRLARERRLLNEERGRR